MGLHSLGLTQFKEGEVWQMGDRVREKRELVGEEAM